MKKKKIQKGKNTKGRRRARRKEQIEPEKGIYNKLVGVGIICLLGIFIYYNSFVGGFHLDDLNSIVNNTNIRSLNINTIWDFSQTRFVVYFTFAINYYFGELNLWGYHFVNLIIHLITSCLVYWLTLVMFSTSIMKDQAISIDKKKLALIAGLLFVSHPLATQSVTYIVQRTASLVALFYLLSIFLYMKGRLSNDENSRKYIFFGGALTAAILAMLTKQNAFTLPFAIVLVEICFFQPKKFSISFKNPRVIVTSAVLIGFITILFTKFSSSVFNSIPPSVGTNYTLTPMNYLFTQFSVILKYIQLLILPVNQNLDYDYPLSNSLLELRPFLSMLVLLSILSMAIYLFKKHRIISFGIFWFFLTIATESSFIPIDDLIFEHRTYLPSFGFFLVLSVGLHHLLWKKYRYITITLFISIIAVNSVLAYNRNKIWQNETTLWTDVVSKSPNKARPNTQRGSLYRGAGQDDKAIEHYNKAISIFEYSTPFINRGIVYASQNQFDKALKDFNRAIELNPDIAMSYNLRGLVYLNQKRWKQAADNFTIAVKLNPRLAEAYSSRGIIATKFKDWDASVVDFTLAIEADPTYTSGYVNRGLSYNKLGQWDKALADLSKALELDPSNSNARANYDAVRQKVNSNPK